MEILKLHDWIEKQKTNTAQFVVILLTSEEILTIQKISDGKIFELNKEYDFGPYCKYKFSKFYTDLIHVDYEFIVASSAGFNHEKIVKCEINHANTKTFPIFKKSK